MDESEKVEEKYDLPQKFRRPRDMIPVRIIDFLNAFMVRRRYKNFAAIGDPTQFEEDPIVRWWEDIATLILQNHYERKPIQGQIELEVATDHKIMSQIALARIDNESGDSMSDMYEILLHNKKTQNVVQSYGRFHTLTIIRWMSELFSELAREGAEDHQVDALYGLWEFLQVYRVPLDEDLIRRKIWPPR